MYYEEKIIDEILHWRINPHHDFVPYTPKELTSLLLKATQKIVDILAEKGGEG